MKLTILKNVVNRLLGVRGLRLAPVKSYGLSQAADINNLWQDLRLPPPLTIIDIGANQGLFSLEVKSYFPNAKVIAIEPNPALADYMKGCDDFRNIEVVNCAIGDSHQSMSLNIYAINGIEDTPISTLSHHGGFADVHGIHPSHSIEVQVAPLDHICLERNIQSIDICKIDVEGYEIPVLRGAADLLASHRIKIISIEWSTRGGQAGRVETTLGSLMREMGQHGYLPIGSSFDWCKAGPYYFNNNMLFMCSSMLSQLDQA